MSLLKRKLDNCMVCLLLSSKGAGSTLWCHISWILICLLPKALMAFNLFRSKEGKRIYQVRRKPKHIT